MNDDTTGNGQSTKGARELPARGLAFPVIIISVVILGAMSLYELINEIVFPKVQLLGSHIGAVVLSAITAAITAYFILRKYRSALERNVKEVSERRRIEKALRESEELYRAVVENVADGIAITMGTERVFVNRAFLDIHGIPDPSAVLGQSFDRFILPEDSGVVRERILSSQRREAPEAMTEYRILRPDGAVRTLQASITSISHKGRAAALAVLRDVTQIKTAELEIIRLNKELEQHVRDLEITNHDLEAFNSTVSHDLRIPLIAIDGFSRRMAEKYGHTLDQKCAELLARVRSNVKRMDQLIEDLLAYSRLGRQILKHEPILMEQVFNDVIDELRGVYPEGDVVVRELPEGFGDVRAIRQVVANLLGNAFKFSKHRPKRIIEIWGWKAEGECVYSVKDNGAGFDMTDKDKLFEIFTRLHGQDEFEGTGIGLAIVKRLITLHGGRVWAEGVPGEGATFYFSLPDKPEVV
jgi:PAS domain S-box-containing protein